MIALEYKIRIVTNDERDVTPARITKRLDTQLGYMFGENVTIQLIGVQNVDE